MSQQELLRRVVEVLGRLGIEYMVSGSLVSSLQGEPRATHDIDVVVALEQSHVKLLPKAFPPPEYYLSEESVVSALETAGMFNLIAVKTGDKVDFWILTDALRVYEVQYGHLNLDYLEEWAGRLGVEPLYKRMLQEAEPI